MNKRLRTTSIILILVSTSWFKLDFVDAASVKNEKINTTKQQLTNPSKLEPLDLSLRNKLASAIGNGETRHIHVRLARHPTIKERNNLNKLGITLHGHIGSLIWRATISKAQSLDYSNQKSLKTSPTLGLVRAMHEISARQKITAQLLEEGVSPKHRHADGSIDILVGFYKNIPNDTLDKIIKRHNGIKQGETSILNKVIVRLQKSALLPFANEDEVKWITFVPLGDSASNENSRRAIGALKPDNSIPYSVTGSNVQVGIWDIARIYPHADFGSRLTIGEDVGPDSNHATHVAGTLAGDGSIDIQRRGIANSADIYSYSISDSTGTTWLDQAQEHVNAMTTSGIDLTNNSWGQLTSCFFMNGYTSRSEEFDQVVRGTFPASPGPLPVVFAAGNNGTTTDCAAPQKGSLRVPGATAKNPITVGDVDISPLPGNPPILARHSSRGPVEYNMLKPDVVAPGCSGTTSCAVSCTGGSCSTCVGVACNGEGVNSTITGNTYGFFAGTSMAAPAVTGTMALMLEQYRDTYFSDVMVNESLLPSTYKAILTHSAVDLNLNPTSGLVDSALTGPDYNYGYGLINAEAALNTIKEKRFNENLLNDGDIDIYAINVPINLPSTFPADTKITKIRITLAWDDVASEFDSLTFLAEVENDLELLVISPQKDKFYTPWELNPSTRVTTPPRNSFSEITAASFADNNNIVEQIEVTFPDYDPTSIPDIIRQLWFGLWYVKIKTNPAKPLTSQQPYSLVASIETNHGRLPDAQLLGPEVNIMQVLDVSGSMNLPSTADPDSDPKIDTLKGEAKYFISLMKTGEPHKIGLVQYNHNQVAFADTSITDLSTLTASRKTTLTTDGSSPIDGMIASGATSIGDGLEAARTQLTSVSPLAPHRVILLVTDGKENSPQMIADIQDSLINDGIRVYPLGLGHGTGINSDKLSALADATGGAFRIAADDPDFQKLYLEVLAGAIDWSISVDPIYKLAKNESINIPVTIANDETAVLFTAYWQNIDQAIDLTLISPTGKLITANSLSDPIPYGDDARHAYFKLDLPWTKHEKDDWLGTWKMVLTGKSTIPDGQKVTVSASALVEGGTKFNVSFDKPVYRTGESVVATAQIRRNHRSVSGARVLLICDVPTEGAGNILHDGQVDPNQLDPSAQDSSDPVSLMEQKLRLLDEASGETLLTRDELLVELFDDGSHSDESHADGIYANSFSNTEIAGTFSCRFLASDISTGHTEKTHREWTIAFHNEVDITAEASDIDLQMVKQTADGATYNLTVVPRDRFGNYLGPGHPVSARWQKRNCGTKGCRFTSLNDPQVRGIYQGQLFLPILDIYKNIPLQIKVGDEVFNNVQTRSWSYSLHAGWTSPQGNLSQTHNGDLSVALDLDYRLDSRSSIVGLLGYYQFDGKTSAIQDTHWLQLSADYKYLINTATLSPYIMAGIGYYKPKSGSSDLGTNLGIGFDYKYSSSLTLEAGLDYHKISDSLDTEFFNLHLGVIKRF